jgi:predicted  nucleic acid-binding Zn-ribbon protein
MQELHDHINRIQDKLAELQKQYTQAKKEQERLQQTFQLLQEKDRLQQARIEELERQLEVVRATRPATMKEADRQALEKRINQYLKEIEQCIALLNE